MSGAISRRAEQALRGLFAHAAARPDATEYLVDQLVDAELHRRSHPDEKSGAFHALALTQGSLLKEEYDLGTHGHASGWTLHALLADPVELMVYDMNHGFPAGDAALKAIVQGLKDVCPKAKVVRTHTDGFAALLGPTAEQLATEALIERAREALVARVDAVAPAAAKRPALAFTVAVLQLEVVDPPNWQVLGPLVWAECERAHIIARRTPGSCLLQRRVVLGGRLPELGDPVR